MLGNCDFFTMLFKLYQTKIQPFQNSFRRKFMSIQSKYGSDAELLWKDRKRFFGLPLSFTRYSLVKKPGAWVKLFLNVGFLSNMVDEINAYRICDINLRQTLLGKMFNYGTVTVFSSDESKPTLHLQNIKNPYQVRDLISSVAEEQRKLNNIRMTEFHAHE